jgi:hypothetical protein
VLVPDHTSGGSSTARSRRRHEGSALGGFLAAATRDPHREGSSPLRRGVRAGRERRRCEVSAPGGPVAAGRSRRCREEPLPPEIRAGKACRWGRWGRRADDGGEETGRRWRMRVGIHCVDVRVPATGDRERATGDGERVRAARARVRPHFILRKHDRSHQIRDQRPQFIGPFEPNIFLTPLNIFLFRFLFIAPL